jgi:hypothetical protein
LTVQLIDDLDGTVGDSDTIETVVFGLDGVVYEIDLGEGNADALRDLLGEYIEHGRRTGGRAKRGVNHTRPASGPAASLRAASRPREQLTAIREWARANGHVIADRGRIPAAITQAFDDAHDQPQPKKGSGRKNGATPVFRAAG